MTKNFDWITLNVEDSDIERMMLFLEHEGYEIFYGFKKERKIGNVKSVVYRSLNNMVTRAIELSPHSILDLRSPVIYSSVDALIKDHWCGQ